MVQGHYFALDFRPPPVTILAVSKTEPDNDSVLSTDMVVDIEADGVDVDGNLTGSKTVSYRYQNVYSSGENGHRVATMTQTPGGAIYNGIYCQKK